MKQEFKVCEVKLSYKPIFKLSERPEISSSQMAYEIFRSHWDEETMQFLESFKVLLLNRGNRVLGLLDLSVGGLDHTTADMRVIFAAALKAGATGLILAHNHPSGTKKPSTADISITKRINKGGGILGIKVLDHLIVTHEGYYSFLDEGTLDF